MSRKLTKEEFINREPDLLSGRYSMLGNYVNTRTKTLFKHNKCGFEWMLRPNNFYNGKRCPKCNGRIRISKDEFCKREEDIQSGEYQIVGVYKNTQTKVLIKHNVCEYEWMIRPYNFRNGKRCPKCAGNAKLTKEEFINRESDLLSGEYQILGNYVNAHTKTLFRHITCGYEWMTTPNNFYNGRRCPRCSGTQKLTKREFCEREEDIVSGEYIIIGEYINTNIKTLFRHNICGYKWETTPAHFYSGKRCPKCNQSKGEKSITNILEEINIPFESQKRFNTCKYKRTLPFDFYVNDSFLVEYDGEQHFTEVDYFGGDKNYELGQLRDNIKTKWAKDNGIPLVRIPYTEFDNIEQIIKDNIEKYSIQKVG